MARHDPNKYRRGDVFGTWTLTRYVDSGGNGEVWEADSTDGRSGAMKILFQFGGDRYQRFRREVEIAASLDEMDYAILPLLDSSLPSGPNKARPPWFVMPFATSFSDALRETTLLEKVAAVRDVARTLASLAAPPHEIHHRDLKPQNLFQYQGRFCVGDFGLAVRPSDPGLTAEGHVVGPFFLLPSEVFMKNADPDWGAVDVHCLAMSLWLIATGEDNPPRGPIRAEGEYSLRGWIEHDYLAQLDGVLAAATHESPSVRPAMNAFAQALDDWIDGFLVRDGIREEVERRRAARNAVLRELAAFVQRPGQSFSFNYSVEPGVASEIPGLTEEDVSEAIEELVEHGLLTAEPSHVLGRSTPIRWVRIYPTAYGREEVDDAEVLAARGAPIVRALLEPVPVLSLQAGEERVDLGGTAMRAEEAWYLLSYLEARGLVSFRLHHEGGSSLLLVDARATSRGREWLAARYS